ncbi:MAG: hypothetical protein KBT34_02040 [Prevotella sp.]|nr:hypothetical protein [Candidatus Prevotella equi]
MKHTLFTLLFVFAAAVSAFAANTKTQVSQVTSNVTVSGNVDYIITSDEPFTTTAIINITNTEHATVILSHVKPSKVISSWLNSHVQINGVAARNNVNCQVKMYASGAIIMPYAKDIKPLTVYSEQNFGGDAVNDFGLENTGGFMNTLTAAKLNNKIRSFKLKRGYMVTFSTLPDGYGYQRCFIADKEDLELATLPFILDQKISSYRVFVWYDAQKKGVADDTRIQYLRQVGGSWSYSWGLGTDLLPDAECVPNHIKENWPSPAEIGKVTYSCHMKTNNEPGNSADPDPQSVAEVLSNWQDLMRTGFRLCSESSHDGSIGHLTAFLDSVDARGWRCDLVDLHCYWNSGSFGDIANRISKWAKNRPAWISEWVWGSSWNNEGAFQVSDRGDFYANQQRTYDGTVPILQNLNNQVRVERYAYWNSEANCSKIYRDAELTKLGEYYRDMETPIGYDRQYEYVPKYPPMYGPSNLTCVYDTETRKVTLRWREKNGEYNQSMVIQAKAPNKYSYSNVFTVEQKEKADDYEVTIDGVDGYTYRVEVVDINGTKRYTNEVKAVAEELKPGDPVTTTAGATKYIGGNQFLNGNFELGLTDWTNGAGEPLAAPYFEAVPLGGVGEKPFLQCYGTSSTAMAGSNDPQSVKKIIKIESNTSYYVAAAGRNNTSSAQFIHTAAAENPTLEARKSISFNGGSTNWEKYSSVFTTSSDIYLRVILRALGGKAQFSNFYLAKLFDTKEEALADAKIYAQKRVEVLKKYYAAYPQMMTELDNLVAQDAPALEIETAISNVIKAINNAPVAAVEEANAQTLVTLGVDGVSEMAQQAIDAYRNAPTAQEKNDAQQAMTDVINDNMNILSISVANGDMANSDKWTRVGTYLDGIQTREPSVAGRNVWHAKWNISAEDQNASMGVAQKALKNYNAGLYALEAKAATDHYCVSDQHAYIKVNDDATYESNPLAVGVVDIPTMTDDQRWSDLHTPYVYLTPYDVIELGFIGTKKNTADGLWMPYNKPAGEPDNHEGSWIATDFNLRYIPLYRTTADSKGYGTICLPYTPVIPQGVKLYSVVGSTSDKMRVALQEETEPKAGYPYIYRTEPGREVTFLETGNTPAAAKTNVGGLYGKIEYSASSGIPAGSLILKDGLWVRTTERLPMEAHKAFLRPTNLKNIATEPWEGDYMTIVGLGSLLLGDADKDGAVTIADAQLVVRYFLGEVSEDALDTLAADIDGDGKITMEDANAILNMR